MILLQLPSALFDRKVKNEKKKTLNAQTTKFTLQNRFKGSRFRG